MEQALRRHRQEAGTTVRGRQPEHRFTMASLVTFRRRVAAVGLLLALAVAAPTSQSSPFDSSFTSGTMRVDYFHWEDSARRSWPSIASSLTARGPGAIPGSWTTSTSASISSRSSIARRIAPSTRAGSPPFTANGKPRPEYRQVHRSFHESLRFPWPKSPVQIVLKKRDAANSFHEFWSTVVDPDSRFVNRADPPKAGGYGRSSRTVRLHKKLISC